MTTIALGIALFERTGHALPAAYVATAAYLPSFLAAPLIGVAVERYTRRSLLIASNACLAVFGVALILAVSGNRPALWPIYLLTALGGLATGVQQSVWDAAIPSLLPERHLGRAGGMDALTFGIANAGGPVVAAALYATAGLRGVLVVDVISFCLALATAVAARCARLRHRPPRGDGASVIGEVRDGWRYISRHGALSRLFGLGVAFNFTNNLTVGLIIPLLLVQTGGAVETGSVIAAFGLGGVLGGIAVTILGDPRDRVRGMVISMIVCGVLGQCFFGLAGTTWLWMAASFANGLLLPVINASDRALWQVNVDKRFLGRAMATRRLSQRAAKPLALLTGAALADHLLVPAFDSHFKSIEAFGPPAAHGIHVMFLVAGGLTAAVGAAGALSRALTPLRPPAQHRSVVVQTNDTNPVK